MNVTEIVQKYKGQLKGFIRQRVNSNEDAEDILQNIFYQLAKADSAVTPVDNMLAWLYTVARNQITDLWRKKKTLSLDDEPDDEDGEIYARFEQILLDDSDSPEQLYFRSIILEEIDAALSELPPEQKEIFELTEIQGLPFKEISEKTGVGVNTLLSRKRYAVKFLQSRLSDLYYDLLT